MKYKFPIPRALKPKRKPDLTLTEEDENWLVANREVKRKENKPGPATKPQ